MERRTSFALDETTILRHVSQSEVVRRAIEKAEAEAKAETDAALGRLRSYLAHGGIEQDKANAYLDEVAGNRADRGRDR
jgi:Arc/MetJ-type ribon-helix-helix transcriptional regulator